MSQELHQIIKPDNPADWAYELTYMSCSLIRTARLALENETSGGSFYQTKRDAANTLEVAEALMEIAIDGTEQMSRHRLASGKDMQPPR